MFPLLGEGDAMAVSVEPVWGVGGERCGPVVGGCPLIGRHASWGCRPAVGGGMPILPLPVFVLLWSLDSASSPGGPSRRALLPDRVDPSGRPPSERSQSSSSGGRAPSLVLPPLGVVLLGLLSVLSFCFRSSCCRCCSPFVRCFCHFCRFRSPEGRLFILRGFGIRRCLLSSGLRFCGCCCLCRDG